MRTSDLIAPLFVREGITEPQPIVSLPGVVQHTRDSLRKEVVELAELGCAGRDPVRCPGRQGRDRQRRVTIPTASCSSALGDLRGRRRRRRRADRRPVRRRVHRPRPLRRARRSAVTSTTTPRSRSTPGPRWPRPRPGPHVVAPSGMMDGQVGHLRRALDDDGFDGRRDPRLLGQVRQRPVRAVPRRRRRLDRRRRRPQGLPAGLAQRP